MPASFEGAIRVVKHRGINKDSWIPIPPFWAKYVYAHYGKKEVKLIKIDMNEEGVLTVTPYWQEESLSQES